MGFIPLSKRRALERLIRRYDAVSIYPNAIVRLGPQWKVNGGLNKCQGVVLHSMVGSYPAALGELDNPLRKASWTYSVLKDGRVFWHYPDTAQTWHAGSAFNNFCIGIEHEGGLDPYDEPLTPEQLAASVKLVRWLSIAHQFPLVRRKGLWEHNEVSGQPTACPSGRIPWAAYTGQPEEDDVKPYMAWDYDRKMVWLIGPKGPTWVSQPTELAKLEADLGKVAVGYSADTINALGR